MRKLFAAVLLLVSSSAAAAVPSSQRDALISFYNTTGGPSWKDSTNWLGAPGTECTWAGVRCNEGETSVIELALYDNNLRGTFPSSIGSLPDLRTLLLFDNFLTGTIPSSIGQLTAMDTLVLDRNQLTGAIPSSIGNLTGMTLFNADGNQLTGPLPRELGNLRSLEEIDLSYNEINGPLPAEIGQLSNLRVLDISVNKLSGPIPSSIASLPLLERVGLVINELTGSVPAFSPSQALLHEILLSNNRLEGSIPASLALLPALDTLDLGSNRLSGSIPRELGNLAPLRILTLNTNQLTGSIPVELARLSNLEWLDLGQNQLNGSIPRELSQLSKLQQLSLHANQLTGSIPPELGSLTDLTGLELQTNDLTGPIPVELSRLVRLESIDLSANRLSGRIPPQLGALTKLLIFSVYENELSGSIPSELGNLTDLVILYLTSNRLSGTIPDNFRNLKKLERLYLAGNEFTGSIPEWIGELTLLKDLNLAENQFTGVIPPSIGNLRDLEQLFLDYNQLTGSIPREIGNDKKLLYLSMELNDISGTIPPEVWNLTELLGLRLTGNRLSGTLPAAVGNLRKLEALTLMNNDLEGTVPAEIGNLTNLMYLDLTSNFFSGPIPSEIGKLTKLLNLGLGGNAFRGEVPKSLTNLTGLMPFASDIGLNAVFTTDAALRQFFNTKQFDGDFERTQTVTPPNVRVTAVTDRSATVEWDLVRYTEGEGGYQVLASKTPGGPSVALATTSSKEISSLLVRGLDPLTPYFFSVATVSHPNDYQKNLLVSDFSAAVTATTAQRVTAPADVDVTEAPAGLVQIDGQPVNEDSFTLTNFGDAATNITFFKDGDYFTFEPVEFALGPGASQVVRVRSVSQPPRTYYGGLDPEGDGVGGDIFINITLLSVSRPAGTVIAEALATRVDVAGAAGSDSVGQARFRNRGTAPLSGLVVSDQPYVVPNPDPITIDPGQIGTVNFRVVRARRPPESEGSALTANLMLVYVDGSIAQLGAQARQGLLQRLFDTPGVNVTLVTVVDQPKPPTSIAPVPQFLPAEVALFVPGIASLTRSVGRFVSDVSILNVGSARSVNDLRAFFTLTGAFQSTVATLNAIDATNAVTLANVVANIYGTDNGTGSLQLRSASAQNLNAIAKLVTISGGGAMTGDIPVFRSDRSAAAGQQLLLPGVRKTSSMHSDLYLQETSGQNSTARLEFLNASGGTSQVAREVGLGGFAMAELLDAIEPATATVVITNASGSGRLSAYARLTDEASGDTWSVVDWSRFNKYRTTDAVRVPFTEVSTSTPSSGGRRRAVRQDVGVVSTTEVTIFNPATDAVRVTFDMLDAAGRSTSRAISIRPRETVTTTVAAPAVQAVITPAARGQVAVTARIFRGATGTFGTNVPVVDASTGLRVGQVQRFANLDDSTAATVAASKPGTFRTAFGLVETSGLPVTVRARIALDQGRSLLATATIAREFTLAPNQHLYLDNMVRSIVGPARETSLGELHNLQVAIEVTDGRGSIVPFVVVTDNGTGDTYLRIE